MKSLSNSLHVVLSMTLALGVFTGLACDDDAANGPTRGGVAGSTGAGGPDAACPSSLPAEDASCSEEGKVCTYGQTSQPSPCSPGQSWGYMRATCKQGQWGIGVFDGMCPGTPGNIAGSGGAGGSAGAGGGPDGPGGTGGAGGALPDSKASDAPFDPKSAKCDPRFQWQTSLSAPVGEPSTCGQLSGWVGQVNIYQQSDGYLYLKRRNDSDGRTAQVTPDGCKVTVAEHTSVPVPIGAVLHDYQLSFELSPGGAQSTDGDASHKVGGEGSGTCTAGLTAEQIID